MGWGGPVILLELPMQRVQERQSAQKWHAYTTWPVKAELEQSCIGCARRIPVGTRIRHVHGLGWMHSQCAKRIARRLAEREDAA